MSHLPFVVVAPESGFPDTDALLAPSDLRDTPAVSSSPVMSTKKGSSATRLPGWIRFPLATLLSLGLSATLYSVVPEVAGFELATVSRSLNEPWHIGALLGWKVLELAVAWGAGYDCM